MGVADRLSSLLGVHAGEGGQAAPAAAFALLCVGASSLSGIAADALFVSHFSLGELSRFYLVSSAVRVVMAFGYAELSRRRPGHGRDVAFLLACSASMVASGLLAHGGGDVAIYAACVVQLLLPPFLPLIAFNAAMSCFDVRQAKRLLPLVAAASTVGTIAAAGGARAATAALGVPSLLHVAAVLCLVAAPLPAALTERARRAGVLEEEPAPRAGAGAAPRGIASTFAETARDIRDVPVVRIVVSYAVLGAALAAFVDFAFKAALKARFGRDEMAAYLGTFGAVSNTAVLLVQLFLTARVVSRFGVRTALQLVPMSLGALSPALFFSGGVTSASAIKLTDTILRFSFGGSVADLLLTPAPADVRTRAKVVIKGVGTPLGAALAAGVLLLFGRRGPSLSAVAVLLCASSVGAIVLTANARRAYAAALRRALGAGGLPAELSREQTSILRSELGAMLGQAAEDGDVKTAQRVLGVMAEPVFSLDDLAPALRSASAAIRQAGVDAASRLARPGDGPRLLERIPPDADDEVELSTLRLARKLGATAPRSRLERVVDLPVADDGPGVDLWAEAQLGLARDREAGDDALAALRHAAEGADSPRRAAALGALGELGDAASEERIVGALASTHAAVYAQAARAAVLVGARGIVATLAVRLRSGKHARATVRALALAGPGAVDDLMAVLPRSGAEDGAPAGRVIAGTVRAARVLAHLGPEAASRVLARFDELGYRSRTAIARALATLKGNDAQRLQVGADRVTRAMELILDDAERLADGFQALGPGLLRDEVMHRISETAVLLLDLASVVGERAAIERARSTLGRAERTRGHALELLEHVLPETVARRTVALLERDVDGDGRTGDVIAALRPSLSSNLPSDRPPPPSGAPRSSRRPPAALALDGWLEECRRFDAADPAQPEPLRDLLDKVFVLRRSNLFAGFSGEELCPVAEIAATTRVPADQILFRQGEPGDSLFVIRAGAVAIERDGDKLRDAGAGEVFGEMALFDGAPRAATVRTTTEVRALRIGRDDFDPLFDDHPELARGMIRVLLGHLRAAE